MLHESACDFPVSLFRNRLRHRAKHTPGLSHYRLCLLSLKDVLNELSRFLPNRLFAIERKEISEIASEY